MSRSEHDSPYIASYWKERTMKLNRLPELIKAREVERLIASELLKRHRERLMCNASESVITLLAAYDEACAKVEALENE